MMNMGKKCYLCIVFLNILVMKKLIVPLIIVLTLMPISLFGQNYSALWRKVKEAENKDLPKTEYELIRQIADKARKEKAYGQLLKAELMSAQVMAGIAPDSLKPAVEDIGKHCEAASDIVLKTVYQTVLWRVYRDNSSLEKEPVKPLLDEALCRQLAQVQDKTYSPFVIEGADSRVFGHDMLSVIGMQLENYETLYRYYKEVGNRQAACLMAAKAWQGDAVRLDSLITEFQDIEEAGELAIARYNATSSGMTLEERYNFIEDALHRWGGWSRMNDLRNKKSILLASQFDVRYDYQVNLPMKPMKIRLENIRNLSSLTMQVYKVKADGDISIYPGSAEGYRKIKPLLTEMPVKYQKTFSGKEAYELFEDSLTLEGLPVGVYMLEFSSNPTTDVVRHLYFVTDVYTLSESQPGKKTRYVVVSATTGQPIEGAHLRIRRYVSYNKDTTTTVKTDKNGEYIDDSQQVRTEVFAYTDNDRACPEMNRANQFRYYDNVQKVQQMSIFTDRAIYRPGQVVHVSVMVYDVTDGYQHQATKGKKVKIVLRDANWKELKTTDVITDAYGMCSADFTLPASVLTGNFTIQANGQSETFRVEEYKRPTFQVEFPEYKEDYKAGDTLKIKASAHSYAGVPVQGAKVSYRVERRMAFWWWSYWRYYDSGVIGMSSNAEKVFCSETVTGDDGSFLVEMPLVMPESEHPLFYNFVVIADVTDTAGETHSGQLSLPLGNRSTALSIDLAEQVLIDDNPTMTFHLRNAAGSDIDATVRYRIDGGRWLKAKTTEKLSLTTLRLASGKHDVEAVCEGDTLKRDFVVFSLDDKRPATHTDDWFYQSSSKFTDDGKPVTVQVGSSDSDVHILYSIVSGDKLIKTGFVDKSNELLNLKLDYKEEYGNGVVLDFAWVKNGRCYTHTAQIQRPLPDKRLKLQWTTFRDRLTPGQEEEWSLRVLTPDGKPADAMLTATLYDMSLDQLMEHRWTFTPYVWLPLPVMRWYNPTRYEVSERASRSWHSLSVPALSWSRFDDSVFPTWHNRRVMVRGARVLNAKAAAVNESAVFEMDDAAPMAEESMAMKANETVVVNDAVMGYGADNTESDKGQEQQPQVQVRENLNETAFFYPQLTTDAEGLVSLKFTLPESLTTWRFMGLAHTTDMCYGMLEGEAVAKKDVMIQPNIPRFVRQGDKATVSARIFNTSDRLVEGNAVLRLIDPVTEKVVYERSEPFCVSKDGTTSVAFPLNLSVLNTQYSILICQTLAVGKDFSDGEQHYLPVLPYTEHVTVTVPFTQTEPGTHNVDLSAIVPASARDSKLTFEYTNNPAWLMIQALPSVGKPLDDNAVSQAASYYANSIGQYIIGRNPKAKTAFDLWRQEPDEASLTSALEKNLELKDIILGETPWVMDADRETEQKHMLADFFDENTMHMRLSSSLDKLRNLQRSDGGWSWWPEMPGSFYMTVAISEMLVRLNALTGTKTETVKMLDKAFSFMGKEVVRDVNEMKKWAKKGNKPSFPSFRMLQWLYLCTLDGRSLPSDVQAANDYLLPLLKKDVKSQTIYEKAMTAVILSKTDVARAKEYARSLKEYTVYREEMGRYYDTPRAGYSWFDYKIPTQTMAVEALQLLTPEDSQTITEMQRWLLQSKRTQAWDTPINSVNAIYAFLNTGSRPDNGSQPLVLDSPLSKVTVDGKSLDMPAATAAIGYVKTVIPDAGAKTLSVEKSSDGTSWGAVYAQFTQPASDISDYGSGLTVKRELLSADSLHVGDRVKVRITITADRDYDFVQVLDKRAACMEPVNQLSGYRNGGYCTPRDYTTNYYFDMFSKGTHVIETEYYIDRAGSYETGTCTVCCAYSPEFRATTKSQTIIVK